MHILIVEDNSSLAELLEMNLELEGYQVTVTAKGEEALKLIKEKDINLIILDVMLPDINGFKIKKRMKNKDIPVIFLTAKGDVRDRILGFKLGADDYIPKPFEMEELIFRIKAVLSRTYKLDKEKISAGPISLDTKTKMLEYDGENIDLTKSQYIILKSLMENKQAVISREQILEKLWDFDIETSNTRTVDMHIKRLREKLGSYRDLIQTVYGVGYKVDLDEINK